MERLIELQNRNHQLQGDLIVARENPPTAVPQQPAQDNNNLILQQLLAAQQATTAAQLEANRLREQAHQATISTVEAAQTTFPSLKDFTNIHGWNHKLLAVLAKPRFAVQYDAIAGDIVADGKTNPTQNSDLFSELLNNAGPSVKQFSLSKEHLRNDGVGIVHKINETYNRSWSTMEKREKEIEWKSLKMSKEEDFDSFFTRCLNFRKDMVTNGLNCTEDDLRAAYILGLTSHFTPIQEKLDDLLADWRNADIHTLPDAATKSYANKISIRNLHKASKDTHREQTKPQANKADKNKNRQNQDNTNDWTKESWDRAIADHRKQAIDNEIMDGLFDVGRYLHTVPEGCCL